MNDIVIITSHLDAPLDLRTAIHPGDYIICTDGGYDIACRCGVQPHMLLGDMDSIRGDIPGDLEIRRFPPEKDNTDLDLALKTAIELGARTVRIVGGIGGRLDHTVANMQLLSQYSESFDKLIMFDGKNQCFLLQNGRLVIPARENCYLSLFSLSEKCTGVTISGVKYPLKNHTLTRKEPLGVSNEFTEKNAILYIEDGDLLIVLSME